MKQILLKTWLLMMCLLVGVGNAWAEDVTATLTGNNMIEGTKPSTSYADHNTGITDDKGNVYKGKWTYQTSNNVYYNMIQLKKRESSSSSRIALPTFPGNIKTIKLTITDATATTSAGAGCKASFSLGKNFNSGDYTTGQIAKIAANSNGVQAVVFDLTNLTNRTNGEDLYITLGDAAARIWSIVVVYEVRDTPSNPTAYNVAIANDIVNGTVTASSTTATEGTEITLTATPDDGYKFDSWDVTNASTSESITITNNQFTMPAADVNVSASFSEIQKYTITWSVNGNTSTVTPTLVENGENITFPTGLDDINGKKFVGWSANPAASTAGDIVSGDVAASADATYYAVFATVIPGNLETATLSITDKENITYTNGLTRTDDQGNDWVSYACIVIQTSNKVNYPVIQINKSSNGYYIGSPDFGNNIKSISAKVWNTSSDKRFAYLKANTNTKQPSVSDYGTTEIAANSKGVNIDLTINKDAEFSQFYIYSSAAIGFESIAVTYGSEDVISDYTTTPQASEPSYSEAKALNVTADNGNDLYFTTFSSDKVTFFPEYDEDMTFATAIKTAMVDDTEFILEKIAKGTATIDGEDVEGFFVPANTGVLVQVEYAGKVEKNVPYYEVSNKTVDALEDNDLYAGNGSMLPEGKVWYKLAWADASHAPSTLGFYYGAADGDPFVSTKGKAYLGLTQEQAAKKISFSLVDDEATSIKTVDTVNGTSAVYNLAGQRVAPNAKGMVIVNGKKFINK